MVERADFALVRSLNTWKESVKKPTIKQTVNQGLGYCRVSGISGSSVQHFIMHQDGESYSPPRDTMRAPIAT